jgi:hypothetical protein
VSVISWFWRLVIEAFSEVICPVRLAIRVFKEMISAFKEVMVKLLEDASL